MAVRVGSPLLASAFLARLVGLDSVYRVVGSIASCGVGVTLFVALFVERLERRQRPS
jgi:hypothetical protein